MNKCHECGKETVCNVHGYKERPKTWEYLCYSCHKEIHPNFDEPLDYQDDYYKNI